MTQWTVGDHPRSRGVYHASLGSARAASGSSPLARGLLIGVVRLPPVLRIIPARAGFTRTRGGCAPRPADHPRSRGVYVDGWHRDYGRRGSSPLARGLPMVVPDGNALMRIIPARAGFTEGRSPRRSSATDHPRSRGVYGWLRRPRVERGGSSPLARGLRRVDDGHSLWMGDHPRSRGVYSDGRHLDRRVTGSSPLARGLRQERDDAPVAGRIIPARAGFTGRGSRSPTASPDHPRSRGVYPVGPPDASQQEGSSPLARGLPLPTERQVSRNGIIPARAGFTPCPCRRGSGGWDHPRSRGVYEGDERPPRMSDGSSPLARGLRGLDRVHEGRDRIIPARAGFTPSPSL